MKEIIYLDTDQMNSMLAQLDEGLINNFSLEQSSQESETEGQQSARGKSAGFSGGLTLSTGVLPGGSLKLNTSLGNNGNESINQSKTMLEGQKDVLNKAFHDHALEVLVNKLEEKKILQEEKVLKEGDLYLNESTFRFYDFNLLKKSVDPDLMERVMLSDTQMNINEAKKLLKKRPNANNEQVAAAREAVDIFNTVQPVLDVFRQLNALSSYGSKLLEDLTLIKAEQNVGLLKKDYLRESTEALSFRPSNNRKIKILARVIGKKEIVYDAHNFPMIAENDLDVLPGMMLDFILGSFKIIEQGDLIVSPIAIYYE